MQKELKALIQLIESWKAENLEIAVQIMKGDQHLKKAVAQYYQPILSQIKGVGILSISKVPDKLRNIQLSDFELDYNEVLCSFFHNMPLHSLYYSYQNLKTIPWWIFEIKNLVYLTMTHNELEEIPEAIGTLKNLYKLNFDHNKIREIPTVVGSLSSLVELRLANNQIKEIPEAIFRLHRLYKLQLDFNKISEIPEAIGHLSNLSSLCLENNKITILPRTMLQLKKLSWLSVEGSPLGDQLGLTYGSYVNVDHSDFEKYLEQTDE